MPNYPILAEGIRKYPHITAFDEVARIRFANLDLSVVLVRMIDTAPAAVLPFLAEEMDVLGYRGWVFADTDAKKRALLKSALLLHRKAGTGFAVRRALSVLGYPDAVLIEHLPGHFYDGSFRYNGTIVYGSYSWANFRVIIPMPTGGISAIMIANIKNVIEAWQRLVCELVDIAFSLSFGETVTPTESLSLTRMYNLKDSLGHIYYSGSVPFSGTATYGNNYEDLAVTH